MNRKSGSKCNTNSRKQYTTGKQASSSSKKKKTAQKATKAVQTFWGKWCVFQRTAPQKAAAEKHCKHFGRSKAARVCFSHNNSKECGEPNTEKIRPGVGHRRVEERLPFEIRWAIFVTIVGGQRGSNQLSKNVIDILEGQTLQRWRRGFDGRRPKSSNKQK